MTKLELTIDASTLDCLAYDDQTALILGLPPIKTTKTDPTGRVNLPQLLADDQELERLNAAVAKLTRRVDTSTSTQEVQGREQQPTSSFETLDLVFLAPHAPRAALLADRSPLQGVFSSPIRAVHTAGPLHLSCFTHISLLDSTSSNTTIRIVALEYSREHRSRLLRQEFASWLVEDHIEKSVVATRADGTIVFWNRFATSLYQYTPEEAMGSEIRSLIATKISLEQGNEMMERMAQGEHYSLMYLVSRKDNTEFMAHCTTTPIFDQNGVCQIIVGVSADYSELHNVMTELDELNANLEKEVAARTEQLLTREKHLRMIGTAMRESDTGVLITDQDYRITWCNDAVSRMLGLRTKRILGMFPWDLPLHHEQKHDVSADAGDGGSSSHSLGAGDEKSLSLESYFLMEKMLHEQDDGYPRISSKGDLVDAAGGLEDNSEGGNKVVGVEEEGSIFIPEIDETATIGCHLLSNRPPQ
jgi:PAS domain S-box-containing protein